MTKNTTAVSRGALITKQQITNLKKPAGTDTTREAFEAWAEDYCLTDPHQTPNPNRPTTTRTDQLHDLRPSIKRWSR